MLPLEFPQSLKTRLRKLVWSWALVKEKHRKTQLCHECRDNDKWIMDRISTKPDCPIGTLQGQCLFLSWKEGRHPGQHTWAREDAAKKRWGALPWLLFVKDEILEQQDHGNCAHSCGDWALWDPPMLKHEFDWKWDIYLSQTTFIYFLCHSA